MDIDDESLTSSDSGDSGDSGDEFDQSGTEYELPDSSEHEPPDSSDMDIDMELSGPMHGVAPVPIPNVPIGNVLPLPIPNPGGPDYIEDGNTFRFDRGNDGTAINVVYDTDEEMIRYSRRGGNYYPVLINTNPPAFLLIRRDGNYEIHDGPCNDIANLPRNLTASLRSKITNSIQDFTQQHRSMI